jgi:(E)-4-hydroxy-3-methylbut-2-enyl-diphosphate synthase
MTNTPTRNIPATVRQIWRLEDAGCEIVRVAVPDEAAAEALRDIRLRIHIPLIADIFTDATKCSRSRIGGGGMRVARSPVVKYDDGMCSRPLWLSRSPYSNSAWQKAPR